MTDSELFHAVSDAADTFSDAMLQHALGEHLNVGEIVALARIFLAGGYAGTAHGLIESSVEGDPDNHVIVTPYESGGIGVSFRNYDDDEYWYAVYSETEAEFADRLGLRQVGKSQYESAGL